MILLSLSPYLCVLRRLKICKLGFYSTKISFSICAQLLYRSIKNTAIVARRGRKREIMSQQVRRSHYTTYDNWHLIHAPDPSRLIEFSIRAASIPPKRRTSEGKARERAGKWVYPKPTKNSIKMNYAAKVRKMCLKRFNPVEEHYKVKNVYIAISLTHLPNTGRTVAHTHTHIYTIPFRENVLSWFLAAKWAKIFVWHELPFMPFKLAKKAAAMRNYLYGFFGRWKNLLLYVSVSAVC